MKAPLVEHFPSKNHSFDDTIFYVLHKFQLHPSNQIDVFKMLQRLEAS